jgi:hypothetical protein
LLVPAPVNFFSPLSAVSVAFAIVVFLLLRVLLCSVCAGCVVVAQSL